MIKLEFRISTAPGVLLWDKGREVLGPTFPSAPPAPALVCELLRTFGVNVSLRWGLFWKELEKITILSTYEVDVLLAIFFLKSPSWHWIHFTFGFREPLPGWETLERLVWVSLTSSQACQDFWFPSGPSVWARPATLAALCPASRGQGALRAREESGSAGPRTEWTGEAPPEVAEFAEGHTGTGFRLTHTASASSPLNENVPKTEGTGTSPCRRELRAGTLGARVRPHGPSSSSHICSICLGAQAAVPRSQLARAISSSQKHSVLRNPNSPWLFSFPKLSLLLRFCVLVPFSP